MLPISKKTINIDLTRNLDILAFVGAPYGILSTADFECGSRSHIQISYIQ